MDCVSVHYQPRYTAMLQAGDSPLDVKAGNREPVAGSVSRRRSEAPAPAIWRGFPPAEISFRAEGVPTVNPIRLVDD